jgi:hypothetical protein
LVAIQLDLTNLKSLRSQSQVCVTLTFSILYYPDRRSDSAWSNKWQFVSALWRSKYDNAQKYVNIELFIGFLNIYDFYDIILKDLDNVRVSVLPKQ